MSEPKQVTTPRLFGLDIETECGVLGCVGFGDHAKCDHALDFNRGVITKIAVTDGLFDEHVFDKRQQLVDWMALNPDAAFTLQNGKFDLKFLGIPELTGKWTYDTSLLAFTSVDKIPDAWLADYEEKRKEHNKLRTGTKHRPARHHSLKTLAPYFLGVPAFWEPETGHADNEYVLKDARYTVQLTHFFLEKMPSKAVDFVQEKLLPWAKMLMDMELKGITLDMEETNGQWVATTDRLLALEQDIRYEWAEHFDAWKQVQVDKIHAEFAFKVKTAEEKKSGKMLSMAQMNTRKASLAKKLAAVEDLNLDSPMQLKWLLEERLGLDATNFEGDASTDKETLNKLAKENSGVQKLLTYRTDKKLVTSFYPDYIDKQVKGVMHATFNITGARTGRLSCSGPNLQQCPRQLHSLFIARSGMSLVTRDLSAIEPTILAYYSEDPVLCELMQTGGDFHGTTAVAAFDLECDNKSVKKSYPHLRDVAKTIGLAVLYGAGANQVLMVLQKNNIEGATLSKAKKIVTRIREKYKGVWQFKTQLDKELEAGATIYNLLGRPYSIPLAADVYMKGLNTLIQGSASDHMLDATNRITRFATPLLIVHDEIVCEVQTSESEVVEGWITKELTSRPLMTQYGLIPLRTEGKISKRWEK